MSTWNKQIKCRQTSTRLTRTKGSFRCSRRAFFHGCIYLIRITSRTTIMGMLWIITIMQIIINCKWRISNSSCKKLVWSLILSRTTMIQMKMIMRMMEISIFEEREREKEIKIKEEEKKLNLKGKNNFLFPFSSSFLL